MLLVLHGTRSRMSRCGKVCMNTGKTIASSHKILRCDAKACLQDRGVCTVCLCRLVGVGAVEAEVLQWHGIEVSTRGFMLMWSDDCMVGMRISHLTIMRMRGLVCGCEFRWHVVADCCDVRKYGWMDGVTWDDLLLQKGM
jgi:hypothetical protein